MEIIMPTKAHCISCDQPYSQRRKELGYNFCLDCGEYQATKQRAGWCVAPIAHKQGATLVTNFNDLKGLNKYSLWWNSGQYYYWRITQGQMLTNLWYRVSCYPRWKYAAMWWTTSIRLYSRTILTAWLNAYKPQRLQQLWQARNQN